jgi:hypothetical protein
VRACSPSSWRCQAVAAAGVALLLGSALSACGRGSAASTASTRTAAESLVEADGYVDSQGYVHGDRDNDAPSPAPSDSDDTYVRAWGLAASDAQRRAVAPLVANYYKAAAAGDARSACALLAPLMAEGSDFSPFVPRAYAAVAGSSLFRHRSCEQVETLMFELGHKYLAAGAPSVRLSGLRVRGRNGIALLAFKRQPEHELAVVFADGRWAVDTLLDEEII